MLIGALIGLFLAILWLAIGIHNTQQEVDRINNSPIYRAAGKRAVFTFRWYGLIKPMLLPLAGAIIGYFVV